MPSQTLSEFIENEYQEWLLDKSTSFGVFMAGVILGDITGFLDLMGQAHYGGPDNVPDADSKEE